MNHVSSSLDIASESRRATVANYLNALTGLVGIILFARFLGAGGVGLYYILDAIVSIANRPAGGITTAGIHYIRSEDSEEEYISSMILLSIMVGTIVATVIYLGYNQISILNMYRVPTKGLLSVCFAVFAFSIFNATKSAYAGIGEPAKASYLSAVRGLLETTLQILLVLNGFGAPELLFGSGTASIVSALYVFITIPTSFPKPSVSPMIDIAKYSRWSSLTQLFGTIHSRSDEIIIGIAVSPAAGGIYSSAKRLATPTTIVSGSISSVIMVDASGYDEITDAVFERINRYGSYSSILSTPLIFGSIVVGESMLVTLFGAEFGQGYLILIAAGILAFFNSHYGILYTVLNAIRVPQTVTVATGVSAVLRVMTAYILLSAYGLNGIIPILIVVPVLQIAYLLYKAQRKTNRLYKPKRVIYQFIASLVMCIVIVPIWMLNIPNPLNLVVTVGSGALIYFLALYYLDEHLQRGVKDWMDVVIQ